MAGSANTTQDISKIKESLGQEVVPAVTGKASRILKDQHPKHSIKRVTAGGASLFEIAAAIRSDPTITIGEAIKQGKKEAKEREIANSGGLLRKGAKSFFKSALGNGLGGSIANLFDTESQKEERKLTELERRYEEGNKFKANFLRSLLGENVGGLLAKSSTLTSTKISAFEKYQELMRNHLPHEKPSKLPAVKKIKKEKIKTPTPPKAVKPKSSPQRDEAHKALMALGYTKKEATERLANAPENASVEDLIKHGLNPTTKAISRTEAATTIQTQLSKPESAQAEAAETGKKEDLIHAIKGQEEHNKKVEKDLQEIKDKLDQKQGGNLLNDLLGKIKDFFSGPLAILKTIAPLALLIKTFMKRIFGLLGNIGKAIAQMGGKALKWLSPALEGLGVVDVVAGAGAAAITGAAVYAWQKHTEHELKKDRKQIDDPLKKYGLETDHDHYGYFKLNGKEISGDDLPEIYKNLITAQMNPMQESVGMINKAKDYLKTHQKELAQLQVKSKVTPPIVSKVFNQKKELADNKDFDFGGDIVTAVSSVVATGTKAVFNSVESIKKMLPALAKTNDSDSGVIVKLRNDENSQATYVAQTFDHPATYSGLGNM